MKPIKIVWENQGTEKCCCSLRCDLNIVGDLFGGDTDKCILNWDTYKSPGQCPGEHCPGPGIYTLKLASPRGHM